MKTIDERAKKYGIESANLLCSDLSEEQRDRQAEIYAEVYSKIATEQEAIDIDIIPQLYVRWLMIDGEKPSWAEYANKALEE